MKHIQRFDEGFLDKFRKVNKNDLYIRNPKSSKRVNEPRNSDYFYGVENQDIDLAKDRIMNSGDISRGVFRQTDDYLGKWKFGTFHSGDIWYDISNSFDQLRKISTKLGYIVGSEVYIKEHDKNGRIEEILNGALYHINNGVFESGIESNLTLFYKIENKIYQIKHLEIVQGQSTMDISEQTLKANFYDLIDEEKIEFSIKKVTHREGVKYNVTIKSISYVTPELIKLVCDAVYNSSEQFRSAEGLEIRNININTTDKKLTLTFSAIASE